MEEVKDIPGKIPALGLYPPQNIRNGLPATEWNNFLDLWLLCIDFRLRMRDEQFKNFKFTQTASGVPFLLSYLREYEQRDEKIGAGSKEAKVHHRCYLLLRRLLLGTSAPYTCSSTDIFDLLGSGSIAFHAIPDWSITLKRVWQRNEAQCKTAIEAQKTAVARASPPYTNDLVAPLHRLSALSKSLPEAAVAAIVGSDYLETIIDSFDTYPPIIQRSITEHFYQSLRSFMSEYSKRISLLLDILFEAKTTTDRLQGQKPRAPGLLSSLLCVTPLLRHLKSDAGVVNVKRGQVLVDTLQEFRQNSLDLHPPGVGVRAKKGKGKAVQDISEAVHVHMAAKVSQIHELFPDLPSGYLLRLLNHFADNEEACIAALLEPESLPPDLRTPNAMDEVNLAIIDNPPDLAPQSTPLLLPHRKNMYDGDDFDRLRISSSRIHKGRKDITDLQTLDDRSRNKAATMAALAAFDADDDERDDSYDVADVGGAVDNTLDTDEKRESATENKTEELLWQAWQTQPTLFGRDSQTRISKARRQLCVDTGMDNEQIEGWAIMLGRDPKMQDRLRQRYSAVSKFRGNQRAIESTKWRADASPSDSQDEGVDSSDGRRVGQAGIRGARTWNRGRGRGGGSTAGPADDKATQLARKRKEQGRGRGGSAHNRREGRAKKIGRGMGPVNNV